MNNPKVMHPCSRRLSHSLFIVLLMELTVIQVTTAATWRVSSSQTNAPPDGTAWATAFPTVQTALNVATNGDSVWVAQGTYFENVTISNGVALYGGFVGNELVLEARNWDTNRTILDGRQSNTVVKVAQGATITTRIDGFTIRNGRASSGGGIACDRSSATIVNNRILWNVTTNGGAGIDVYSGSPVIASNLIQGNIAKGFSASGGGIGCLYSSPIIANNRIVANSTSRLSGLEIEFGGALLLRPPVADTKPILPAAAQLGLALGGGACRFFTPSAPRLHFIPPPPGF